MEDDNGLELSLALTCGGPSAASKGKNSSASDTRTYEDDRDSKLINNFKNFLHGGTPKLDSSLGSQRSDPVKAEENFFNNLSKAAVDADASTNLSNGGFWVTNDNRSAAVKEEKRTEERKNLFHETNHQKKREREAHHADLHDRARTSHISINSDDGSTAENEDVADSEADGSTSRLVSHRDDGSKRYHGGAALLEVRKDVRGADTIGVDLQGQKRFINKEFKLGNMPYGCPPQAQSVNIMNASYSLLGKESNTIDMPNTSSYPLPGMMQVMAAANSERQGTQPVLHANAPLMFGYPTVQLPILDKDISRGFVSHPQQLHPSFAGRDPPNSDKQIGGLKISQGAVLINAEKSSQATQYDGRPLERAIGDGKQNVMEGVTHSQTGEEGKGSSTILRAKDAYDLPRAEGHPSEFPAIRPGIESDLKFGGCGSCPNLPWVSTTGPGPNGRTISGVTYRYNATQIRIVCACHGLHMSPEEFVVHAGEEQTNPESGNGLASFPSNNPAASAQS